MEKPSSRSCPKCGAAVSQNATGRPPRYCSPACRRLAGLEIRRLTCQLEVFEGQRWQLEQPGVLADTIRDFSGRTARGQLDDLRHVIGQVEARLRVLMEDRDEPPAA